MPLRDTISSGDRTVEFANLIAQLSRRLEDAERRIAALQTQLAQLETP